MKLIPILLRGTLQEDLQYNFGTVYPISKGTWELAIQSIAFEYLKSNDQQKPDPPPVDEFLYVSCNYVEGTRVFTSEESSIQPAVLSLLHIKIKAGEKKYFPFGNRDYFQVSAPTQKLEFYLKNEHNQRLPNVVEERLNVTVMLLLRRIS